MIQGEKVNEESLGGLGYSEFFIACAKSIQTEEVMRRSPMGKRVSLVLEQLCMKKSSKDIADIAVLLEGRIISTCFVDRKLPSARLALMWSKFHHLRSSPELIEAWRAFMQLQDGLECSSREAHLTLQILLDRILKKIIHNLGEAASNKKKREAKPSQKITAMESNAIRYMAGFVAVKLLKFKKPSKNPKVEHKHHLFVRVLASMQALGQPGEPETVEDYSTLWSELIDRGGLYHINDEVSNLFLTLISAMFNIHFCRCSI